MILGSLSNRAQRPLRLSALLLLLAVAGCDAGGATPRLPPLPESAVILAFGDSLTYGTGASAADSYPERLAGLIDRRVVRSGVPGEVSAAGRRRFASAISRYQPDLVILCHGGNDILRRLPDSETEANLRAMIAEARAAGAAVVLIGVPKPSLFMSEGADFYRRIADDLDLPYLDGALAEILRSDSLKSDAVHPNADGYRRLAEAVAELLRQSGAV